MKITLTKKESEEFFFNALCNGLGEMRGYGLEFNYDNAEYVAAKITLKLKRLAENNNETICFEDVLMEILRGGGSITLIDNEAEDDDTRSITMKEVYDRMPNVSFDRLTEMIKGEDDAYTADIILQTIFFDEVIFG